MKRVVMMLFTAGVLAATAAPALAESHPKDRRLCLDAAAAHMLPEDQAWPRLLLLLRQARFAHDPQLRTLGEDADQLTPIRK